MQSPDEHIGETIQKAVDAYLPKAMKGFEGKQEALCQKRLGLQKDGYEQLLGEKDRQLREKDAQLQKKDEQLRRKDEQIASLKRQLDAVLRFAKGKQSEKLASLRPGQLGLFDAPPETGQASQEVPQDDAPDSAEAAPPGGGGKPAPKRRELRKVVLQNSLLSIQEEHYHPQGYELMRPVGSEVSQVLHYNPGTFVMYMRHRHTYKDNQGGLHSGELPALPIPKSMVDATILSKLAVDKFVNHLPIYRQRQILARDGIEFPESTLYDWMGKVARMLTPLYDKLRKQIDASRYVQVDETPLKVLKGIERPSNSGKDIRLGQIWVCHSPKEKLVLFLFDPSRGKEVAAGLLAGRKGHFQSDGYQAYEGQENKALTQACCMAHARRNFAALHTMKAAADILDRMAQLYQLEQMYRSEQYDSARRGEHRLKYAKPILDELHKMMDAELRNGGYTPQESMYKALVYALSRWEALSLYAHHGDLEIDNNLVENLIRPLAIGRKNYLFAGNPRTAQHAAVMYSLFGTCRLHKVNPYKWLVYVLDDIAHGRTKMSELDRLLPNQWQQPADAQE